MEKKIAYVGIDYHLNSLSIAVMVEGEKNLSQIMREALKMIFRFCFPPRSASILGSCQPSELSLWGLKHLNILTVPTSDTFLL